MCRNDSDVAITCCLPVLGTNQRIITARVSSAACARSESDGLAKLRRDAQTSALARPQRAATGVPAVGQRPAGPGRAMAAGPALRVVKNAPGPSRLLENLRIHSKQGTMCVSCHKLGHCSLAELFSHRTRPSLYKVLIGAIKVLFNDRQFRKSN
jgi:hypothetical protein